jgi:hypothetical protein
MRSEWMNGNYFVRSGCSLISESDWNVSGKPRKT